MPPFRRSGKEPDDEDDTLWAEYFAESEARVSLTDEKLADLKSTPENIKELRDWCFQAVFCLYQTEFTRDNPRLRAALKELLRIL